MSFTPSEVILGATLPLENGSTITFSVAGHVEGERDYDDAVVIFGRKLLKYTNCATDADRLTVRQVVASITSTPLDKVPDVGTPARMPALSKSEAEHLKSAERIAADALGDLCAVSVKLDIPAQKQPDSFGICDKCGEAVPKPQVSRSRTATGRILCIDCMPAPLPAPEPAKPAPQPATTAPAPKPAAPEGEVCEGCGAPVPKSQAKLSQLFQSKTLCKTCMDSNGGA